MPTKDTSNQVSESNASDRAPGGVASSCGARTKTGEVGCRCKDLKNKANQQLDSDAELLRQRIKILTRQASMAEVASTALHNVGNVLNSVNVSAALVVQRLRESRVQKLGRALNLVHEHAAELGKFLTEDPKGKMLPSYLETLSDHLRTEHDELLREMESLHRSVEHMKEIVSVQQSYATKCGVLEALNPAELVEDALRMNWGAFERHGVTIIREFFETPPVMVDKHKVLQILVNLIRNAKYAMDERGIEEKILTLGIRSEGPQSVAIEVRDNGIGIAPQNLNHIFDYGFTTKRDGHGFGLHSGQIAATELGGALNVRSEGIGKGATFSLELPLAQPPIDNQKNARGTTNHPGI